MLLKYNELKFNLKRPKIWRKSLINQFRKPWLSYVGIKKEEENFKKYKEDVGKEITNMVNANVNASNNTNELSMNLSNLFESAGRSIIFNDDIESEFLLKHSNKVTLEKKLQPWCSQLNMNVPFITQKGYGILGLINKFKDIPAFVIAAGPSLKNNIEELKKVGNKGIIIAVDTAFRPLLDAGIEPHFVMAHDANHNGAKFFLPKDYFPPQTLNDLKGGDLELAILAIENDKPNILKDWHYNTVGVFVDYVSPLTIRSFCGDSIAFYAVVDPGLPVYNTMANATNWRMTKDGKYVPHDKGGIIGGSSVGHTALYLAHALGCNPISLVGLDLSYPEGKTYVDGASNQKDTSKIQLVDVEDISNRKVKTNVSMFSYRMVFERMLPHLIAQNDLTVYNCTEHKDGSPTGILEVGAEPKQLKWVIQEHCLKDNVVSIEQIKQLLKDDKGGEN